MSVNNLKKNISIGLLVVFAGSFFTLNTQAEEASSHGDGPCKGMGMKGKNMPTFADFDLDADGKIVEQEFNEGHAKRMSEMAAEGHQMKHAGDAPGFSGIDTNGDNEISKEEFAAHQSEHHQQMHVDKHKQDQ